MKHQLRPELLKESLFIRLFKFLLTQDDIFLSNQSGAYKSYHSSEFRRELLIFEKRDIVRLIIIKMFCFVASIAIITMIIILITK